MTAANHDLKHPVPVKSWARVAWLVAALCLAAGCGDDEGPPAVDAAVTMVDAAAAVDAATAVDGATLAVDAALPPTLDGWQVTVAPPAFNGSTVSTTFTAQGTGMRAFGTCQLADLHGAKACATAADCATGAQVALVTGHFEYCAAPHGQSQKICWTRNGADADWCNKVPPPGRVAGTYTTPAVAAAQLPGSGTATRWIGLACLNAGTYPAFTDGPKPPCASADPAALSYHLYVTSVISTFTAP